MTKLRIPKIKIKLSIVLWIIFAAVIVIEVFTLYRYLITPTPPPYLPARPTGGKGEPEGVGQINLEQFQKAVQWLKTREDYKIPDYKLQEGAMGRENPFLEYR